MQVIWNVLFLFLFKRSLQFIGGIALFIRRGVCFLIVFLLSLCSLIASESIALSWEHNDSDVSLYRLGKGNGEWFVTQTTEATVEHSKGSIDTYRIQASYDGEAWSSEHAVIFTDSDLIEVIWSFECQDDSVSFYRWRLDGGEWHTEPSTVEKTSMILSSKGRHFIEVCYSYDGIIWSEPDYAFVSVFDISQGREGKSLIRMEASASASLSFGLYDFYNGHHVEGARYLMRTDPGFSADSELLLSIGRNFRLSAGYSYYRESKKETVIPDAFIVDHHQIGGGFDILFPIKEKWRIYLGLSAAYSFDVNSGYWSPSFFLGGRIGIDYLIGNHFSIGLISGVKAAHNDAPDPLYKSYSLLIDPIGLRMGVIF